MDEALLEKARTYAERHQVQFGAPLGSGNHGSVLAAERKSNPARFAVKFCKEEGPYQREVLAYEILKSHSVREIAGFNIPMLLGYDDDSLAIEMTIVKKPFLLDFGGAYIEEELPDFPENVWVEWREQKQEEFGEHWPIVEDVLAVLRSYGVFMLDIHPRNIVFRDEAGADPGTSFRRGCE